MTTLTLLSCEKLALFEFFVVDEAECTFLEITHYFEGKGLVIGLQKLPNR